MGLSTRGPRGIPTKNFAGYSSFLTAPGQDPQGRWVQSASYTAGTYVFTAPYSGVVLNKRGKVEVFLTATAAGGCGGPSISLPTGPSDSGAPPSGGQAGQWVRRFKVELSPGEQVTLVVPGQPSSGSGASLTFGSYLALSGGNVGGAANTVFGGPATWNNFNGTSGTIVSGTNANDSAIRSGARGGSGGLWFGGVDPQKPGDRGSSNLTLGPYEGGPWLTLLDYSRWGIPGTGGAGLFGNGGGARSDGVATDADADSGGGGGGGGNGGQASSKGGGGQLFAEWRVPA